MWVSTTTPSFTQGSPAHSRRCCEAFDSEFDGRVDLGDFAEFQRVFDGP